MKFRALGILYNPLSKGASLFLLRIMRLIREKICGLEYPSFPL